MDIKELKYFKAIVDNHHNLSKAAEELFVSQPALSKVIRTIEDEFDIDLFYRAKGRLQHLTHEGQLLYDEATLILDQFDQLIQKLNNRSRSPKGSVRIGIPPVIVATVFTRLLFLLQEEYPAITFDVVEVGAQSLTQKLSKNELDFAMLIAPVQLPKESYKQQFLYQDELAVFMSDSHPLAQLETLTLADLCTTNLAILNKTYTIHEEILSLFDKADATPDFIGEFHTWNSLLEYVNRSESVTILPRPLADNQLSQKYTCRTFTEPIPWNVYLCYGNKSKYTQIEELLIDSITKFFSEKQSWLS